MDETDLLWRSQIRHVKFPCQEQFFEGENTSRMTESGTQLSLGGCHGGFIQQAHDGIGVSEYTALLDTQGKYSGGIQETMDVNTVKWNISSYLTNKENADDCSPTDYLSVEAETKEVCQLFTHPQQPEDHDANSEYAPTESRPLPEDLLASAMRESGIPLIPSENNQTNQVGATQETAKADFPADQNYAPSKLSNEVVDEGDVNLIVLSENDIQNYRKRSVDEEKNVTGMKRMKLSSEVEDDAQEVIRLNGTRPIIDCKFLQPSGGNVPVEPEEDTRDYDTHIQRIRQRLENSSQAYENCKKKLQEVRNRRRFEGSDREMISILGKEDLSKIVPTLVRFLQFDEKDAKQKLGIYRTEPKWWPRGVFFGDPNNKARTGVQKPVIENIRQMCQTLLLKYEGIYSYVTDI